MRILVCYDGSADARGAIDRAATLFPGAESRILVVWDTASKILAGTGLGLGPYAGIVDFEELNHAAEQRAKELASEGAEAATLAGLAAVSDTARLLSTTAETILDSAAELDADAIVIGTRGRSGVRSLFLGSVSHAVLQHSDRPVVVIATGEVARERAEHSRRHAQADRDYALAGSPKYTHASSAAA